MDSQGATNQTERATESAPPVAERAAPETREHWSGVIGRQLAQGASPAQLSVFIRENVPAGAQSDVMRFLQQERGNSYVQQILAVTDPMAGQQRKGDPAKELIAKITAGTTSLKIGGDARFKQKIIGLMTTLVSTPSGLDLVTQLAAAGHPVKIEQSSGDQLVMPMFVRPDDANVADDALRPESERSDGSAGPGNGSTLYVNPALPETFALDAEGKQIPCPAYITLAHELIHCLHGATGHNRRHKDGTKPGHDNAEEEQTVETGEVSENTIRMEHKLPLRSGHGGGLAENDRTRVIARFKQQGKTVFDVRDRDVITPVEEKELRALLATCDEVLALEDLWEVALWEVHNYRDQASMLVEYPTYAASFWKKIGPQVTAGYAELRATLVASQKDDPEYYRSVMSDLPGALDPAKVMCPAFATLDRAEARKALAALDALLQKVEMLGSRASAAADASTSLRNAIVMLQRP